MATADSRLKCVKCGEIRELGSCNNCGGTYFTNGLFGNWYECTRCKSLSSEWICSCGTRNQIRSTFVDKCFIATAVYGDGMSPDVITLRRFRDTKLRGNFFGNKFITIYEKTSPPLADWIITRPLPKTLVKQLLLSPIVWVINRLT